MGKSRSRRNKVVGQQAAVKIGYDGTPPMFMPARDLAGEGKREKIDGPQNINVDRLEWLLAHHLIEQHHHSAGRKLQKLWETAEISSGLSLVGAGGGAPTTSLSDRKCDAIHALKKVRAALSPMNWRIIELVVIDRLTVYDGAKRMRFHEKAAVPMLVLALDSLAQHFGLCLVARA